MELMIFYFMNPGGLRITPPILKSCWATTNSSASRQRLPTICTPTGIPSWVNPMGITTTGLPVRLNIGVLVNRLAKFFNCIEFSVVRTARYFEKSWLSSSLFAIISKLYFLDLTEKLVYK